MTRTPQLDPTGGQSSIGGTGRNTRFIHCDSEELHPGGDTRPPYLGTLIDRVLIISDPVITRTNDPLNDTNWDVWRERMTLMLQLCGVDAYAKGEIVRPNPEDDPESVDNWTFNDTYAKVLITNNITSTQMVYFSQCPTAHDMWVNLEAVHEPRDPLTAMSYMRNLRRTTAKEGANISEHLDKLKQYRERINRIGDNSFEISDFFFKVIISASLPPSWDALARSYVDNDPENLVSSQQLIGILKEEYFRREARKQEIGMGQAVPYKPSLVNRNRSTGTQARTRSKLSSDMYCKRRKRRNNNAEVLSARGELLVGTRATL